MAISYSGIVGYGKFNLPSVDSWGTNNNILKDPPRSITTRRRDKVGLNSTIIQDVEMSRDRVAEVIKAYPRGVNPMVGVSYNGSGNGGFGSGQALLGSANQAKLPYRVAMAGAFRPPVLAPVDLLPLSRMPRLVTKVNCAVNNPDFQKKLSCAAEKNTYKHKLLNTSCAPKIVYNIKKPSELVDRRHVHTRKNAQAKNIVSKKAVPAKGERSHAGKVVLPRNILRAEALHLNPAQKKFQSGQLAGTHVSKHISTPLGGSFEAPQKKGRIDQNMGNLSYERFTTTPVHFSASSQKSGVRREQTADLGALDYSQYTTNLVQKSTTSATAGPKRYSAAPERVNAAQREDVVRATMNPVNVIKRTESSQPEYKRTFGRKGILVPDGGNYNARR